GISIFGTSGLFEPMSRQALVDTIRAEASIRRCSGAKNMLLTLGNYSESFVQEEMPFPLEKSIKCSNFIGDSLDIALENGFEGVLLVGHIGKMVKLGAGIMNTHSEFADGRIDVLVTCGVLADMDVEVLKKIPLCATADSALDLFREVGKMEKILEILAKKVDYYLNARVKGEIKVGAVIFSYKHKFAVKTKFADDLIKKISEE
ncbi:MAG: cobalt-precorrin-5B (C(1))-methyltransferase, partial [Ruminococcus sp.]|nr:cobalt-precorrin-5B (C(1))-methyltransferase [Ruminococcus sp.]